MVVWKWIAGMVVLSIAVCWVLWLTAPMTTVTDDPAHTFAESIVDHRIPKSLVRYAHTGDRRIVVSRRMDESTNALKMAWIKVLAKDADVEKGTWQKVKEKISEAVRFMSFDENGALLLTDVAYDPNDTLGLGRYVYLQTIRAEVDAKMLGTYVWEFPVYMDDALSVGQKNQFARDLERQDWTVRLIQSAVSALDEGNGSKTTLTERGAVYTGNFYKLTVEVK